jgi:hypothetical protein
MTNLTSWTSFLEALENDGHTVDLAADGWEGVLS